MAKRKPKPVDPTTPEEMVEFLHSARLEEGRLVFDPKWEGGGVSYNMHCLIENLLYPPKLCPRCGHLDHTNYSCGHESFNGYECGCRG